ncbi:deoxynucleotidyltransferase terminal-interacting protein 1-like [Anneissia japonica]|uniref:deoxynucleotidyltransferase terminal-interacting protein 1-like n=2 Tax=Anneissia japonica TaxID=1529436 RepID=UPI0014257CB2|nr:deoxynucleotidyltransferase terminal-interacting protein 1-like [Anneissia japonica]
MAEPANGLIAQAMQPTSTSCCRNGGSNVIDTVADRFQQKKASLTESIRNPFSQTLNTFPPNKHHRLVRKPGQAYTTRSGGSFNPVTTLNLLRRALQKKINEDIEKVFQHYIQFFQLAVQNIRDNYGQESVNDEHLVIVLKDCLDAAKEIFNPPSDVAFTQESRLDWLAIAGSAASYAGSDAGRTCSSYRADERDENIETGTFSMRPTPSVTTRKRKGRPPLHHQDYENSDDINLSRPSRPAKVKSEPVKREGPKWSPSRLTTETEFVMGAKANKALGLGATRGRLYMKHPNLFKYSGDQDDKQWLYDNRLMPATGGKAYLLIKEDILELSETSDYRNNTLLLHELKPFVVPERILQKMRKFMEMHRTDSTPGD